MSTPEMVETTAAGPPGAREAPPIAWGKSLAVAWRVVMLAPGPFVISTLVSLLRPQIVLYATQLLIEIAGQLGAERGADPGFLANLFPHDLTTAGIVFLVASAAAVGIVFAERQLGKWADLEISNRLRHALHDRILRLGPEFHRRHDVAETQMIVISFAPGVQNMLCDIIAFPLVRGLSLISAVLLLLHNLSQVAGSPWWMHAVLIGGLIAMPVFGHLLSQGIVVAAQDALHAQTEVNVQYLNSGSKPLEVNLMGAVRQRSQAFRATLTAMKRASLREHWRNLVGNQLHNIVERAVIAVFVLYGIVIYLVTGNAGGIGKAIVGFAFVVPLAITPISEMLGFYLSMSTFWPQMHKVIEVMEAEPERHGERGRPLPDASKHVRFENVTFAYPGGTAPVLAGLSHDFLPDEVTAIVARAGAGKTTILNLLVRLYRPDSGRIVIEGVPLDEVDEASLRAKVFRVSQWPLWLAGTVRENFLLAQENATDAEIEAVCQRSGFWPVLRGKTRGNPLDVEIPRTIENLFSGGEQRLFAVTRGLLRRPSIMLLDEPTTGIDPKGIADLARMLRPAVEGLTVLVVDHRMSFVKFFGRQVCCLEGGRFTAVGTPGELDRPGTLFEELKRLEQELDAKPGAHGAAGPDDEDDDMADGPEISAAAPAMAEAAPAMMKPGPKPKR